MQLEEVVEAVLRLRRLHWNHQALNQAVIHGVMIKVLKLHLRLLLSMMEVPRYSVVILG